MSALKAIALTTQPCAPFNDLFNHLFCCGIVPLMKIPEHYSRTCIMYSRTDPVLQRSNEAENSPKPSSSNYYALDPISTTARTVSMCSKNSA